MMEVFSFRVRGHCNTSKKKCEIDRFKELLIGFYETNDSTKIKIFFRKKCLLVNPAYVKKDTMSDKTERSPMTMNV